MLAYASGFPETRKLLEYRVEPAALSSHEVEGGSVLAKDPETLTVNWTK